MNTINNLLLYPNEYSQIRYTFRAGYYSDTLIIKILSFDIPLKFFSIFV